MNEEKITDSEDIESLEPRLYELGYHIIPTVAKDALNDEISRLHEAVESSGGVVTSDQPPVLRDLAYTLSKMFANERKEFNSAYFGSLVFNIVPEGAIALKKKLDDNENILRFIIIKTTEEQVSPIGSGHTDFFPNDKKSERVGVISSPRGESKEDETDERKEKLSEVELDKKIEELVVG